jgi:hypothetical protein
MGSPAHISNRDTIALTHVAHLISAERPDLSRCTGHGCNRGEEDEYDQKGSKDAGGCDRAGGVLKDLNDWERGVALKECGQISDAKAVKHVSRCK